MLTDADAENAIGAFRFMVLISSRRKILAIRKTLQKLQVLIIFDLISKVPNMVWKSAPN